VTDLGEAIKATDYALDLPARGADQLILHTPHCLS
jgi:hypothetical protein